MAGSLDTSRAAHRIVAVSAEHADSTVHARTRGRARIGVVVPFSNTNLEPDMMMLCPPGVSIHVARTGGYDVDAIPDEHQMRRYSETPFEEAVDSLRACRPDVMLYGCTSATLAQGLGLEAGPSHANFVLVRFPESGPLGAGEAFERLRRAGIIVRPVAGYGLDDRLRMTIGSAEEMASLSSELERIIGGDREPGGSMDEDA